jgi:hypothetical protein
MGGENPIEDDHQLDHEAGILPKRAFAAGEFIEDLSECGIVRSGWCGQSNLDVRLGPVLCVIVKIDDIGHVFCPCIKGSFPADPHPKVGGLSREIS